MGENVIIAMDVCKQDILTSSKYLLCSGTLCVEKF